jgi:hypothetical protein
VACTPLIISTGPFQFNFNWMNSPSTTFDGGTKTVTQTTSGVNPGIVVAQGTKSLAHSQLPGHILHYMLLGGLPNSFAAAKYMLILDIDANNAALQARQVSLVDFSRWGETNLFTVQATSSVLLPVVNPSPGNGSVFLAYGQDGSNQTDVAIYRSDNGIRVCPRPPSGTLTIQPTTCTTTAKCDSAGLHIDYCDVSGPHDVTCPSPAGAYSSSPTSNTFPNEFVGGCSFTPPTKQFTITNTGNDCLNISSIANSTPFSVQSTSQPLPVSLAPNETLTVTVAFQPTAVGSWNAANLVVSASDGNHNLACVGTAVAASFGIGFNPPATVDFGTVAVGATSNQQLVITNAGSKPLTFTVPPLNASGFTCPGGSATLDCGKSQSFALTFTATSTSSQSATLSITDQASGSPHIITLIANTGPPKLTWSPSSLDFGAIFPSSTASSALAVSNGGTADAHITDVNVVGISTPVEFTATPLSVVVHPGQTGTITVTYSPKMVWPWGYSSSANLVFHTDDPAHPSVSVPLSGSVQSYGCLGSPVAAVRAIATRLRPRRSRRRN